MTCQKEWVKEVLPEYLARRLSPEDAQMVREHLEGCGECRSELALVKRLAEESVPEPPISFWNALPGKVTSGVKDRKQKLFSLPVPVWAGGLAAAVLVILLILSPWKGYRVNIEIPNKYYVQMIDRFNQGLEEEILAVSGLKPSDLVRSLEQDMFNSEELYGFSGLSDAYQSDPFEDMDDTTLRVFEELIDNISPVSS